MLSWQTSQQHGSAQHFLLNKKAQLPAIRITEQPILLTKSKINIICAIDFLSIFAENRQLKSCTRPRPRI